MYRSSEPNAGDRGLAEKVAEAASSLVEGREHEVQYTEHLAEVLHSFDQVSLLGPSTPSSTLTPGEREVDDVLGARRWLRDSQSQQALVHAGQANAIASTELQRWDLSACRLHCESCESKR